MDKDFVNRGVGSFSLNQKYYYNVKYLYYILKSLKVPTLDFFQDQKRFLSHKTEPIIKFMEP